MPVSAPRLARHSTLPASKSEYPDDVIPSGAIFQNLNDNAPLPSRGSMPPAAGWGEWPQSAAPWAQRFKRIWEEDVCAARPTEQENVHFPAARDTLAKEEATQRYASIFPSLSFSMPVSYERYTDAAEDDAASDISGLQYGNGSEWSYDEDDIEMDGALDTQDHAYGSDGYDIGQQDDLSPVDRDASSSPSPVTPFGDFVDRAVAVPFPVSDPLACDGYADPAGPCDPSCRECCVSKGCEPESAPAPAPVTSLVGPSTAEAYKRLAEPLSQWIADYVWKVCTTAPPGASQSRYQATPPESLSTSLRTVLLATLLQPSAVCLAMYYITRLPVYLGTMELCSTQESASIQFRTTLLGEAGSTERFELEGLAPFRVAVLGCMLANKWMDDHTFSNKTWHSISGIPLRWLNVLEASSLQVFNFNLNITPSHFSRWVAALREYHSSLLSASSHPQPIGRPSASPHSVVRKFLEELEEASSPVPCEDECCSMLNGPQPIFLALEERQRAREEAINNEVCDIDLDEDGPLRQEYLPHRRDSRASSIRSCRSREAVHHARKLSFVEKSDTERILPPPAKWSPAADEPVDFGRSRAGSLAPPPVLMMHAQPVAVPVYAGWPVHAGYSQDTRYYPSGCHVQAYAAPVAYGYQAVNGHYSRAYGPVVDVRVSPPETMWQRVDHQAYYMQPRPVWGQA